MPNVKNLLLAQMLTKEICTLKVWESMVSHGFVPSYLIYNQLINGFARAGMEDDAFDVYLKMQEPITNFENVNFQSLCEVI